MGNNLKKINTEEAAQLYNTRFDNFGRNIKTVGWGNKKDQDLRFEMLFRNLNPKGKKILDIGCGLGDLVPYLNEITGGDFSYIGIDIAEKLITDAQKNFETENILFYVGEVFELEIPNVDIAILSGALSFKVDGIQEYAQQTMKRMFQLSDEAACLNFLSKYVDFELDKNEHYYPEQVFSQAKGISSMVNLFHDYPLYEFTVQMIKRSVKNIEID